MLARALTLMLVLIAPSACDDPAPIVLGRLQARRHDAGLAQADAANERDPEHRNQAGDGDHDEREDDDERSEHE